MGVVGMAEAVAGTAAEAGVGMVGEAGTTMAGISAGTSTGGVARDGEGLSLLPSLSMPGSGRGSSAGVPAGGIGVMPGRGIILVGDGAQVPGRGVVCLWVHRSV